MSDEDKGTLINFIADKNIFFAPNGGGKTSLCNALEYKLTGSVKEARRRNLTVPQYIRRNGKQPQVEIEFMNNTFEISDLNDYQKELLENAFIEQNRINAFALLGSRDSGDNHNDIISYVLGLEGLDDFVSYFLKPTSMGLQEFKTLKANKELELFRKDEEGSRHHIEFNKNSIKKAKENIKSLLNLDGKINRRLVKRKLKDLDSKIEEKENKIKEISSKEYPEIDEKYIIKSINAVKRELEQYEKLSDSIEHNIEKVNLAKLYEAISGLNAQDYEYCPACQTNLKTVDKNPFDYAKNSLRDLTMVQTMQSEKRDLLNKLKNKRYNEIRRMIELLNTTANDFTELNIPEITKFTEGVIASDEADRVDFLLQIIGFFKDNLVHFKSFWSNYTDLVKQQSKMLQDIEKLSDKKKLLGDKVDKIRRDLTNWEDGLAKSPYLTNLLS